MRRLSATPIASVTTPGRFVPADLSVGDLDNVSSAMGRRATVSGGTGVPEVFPGITASVEASGLTPGDNLELWIAPGFNYTYFQVLGGGLPTSAIHVGNGTVAADGTLTAPFTLSPTIQLGSYQLVVGVRGERYWPAGTYDDFTVTTPTTTVSAPSRPARRPCRSSSVRPRSHWSIPPARRRDHDRDGERNRAGGGWLRLIYGSAAVLPHRHDGTLGGPATVCIKASTRAIRRYPPQLFHFDTALDRWVDITTSRAVGSVCAV